MKSWLEQARVASGLSVEDCCKALYQSSDDFLTREQNPGMLTLNELRVLMKLFSSDGQQLAWNALCELRPSYVKGLKG